MSSLEIFGSRLHTLDRKGMDRRAQDAIEKMGVKIDPHMVIGDMPVGHKQFTEIARELSKEQLKLLILDEPTAVLTEQEAEALLDSIRSMAAQGISVIFITHRLQEILSVCDKVVIMRDGYVVKESPGQGDRRAGDHPLDGGPPGGDRGRPLRAPQPRGRQNHPLRPQPVGGHAR